MDDKAKQTDPIIETVSRRRFLKMIAAGMGTAVPAFLIPGPDWFALTGSQEATFASWGQTDLSFDALAAPYMDLGDWHMQFLPVVSR